MSIRCDICKRKGMGRYSTRWMEHQLVTLCDECRYGKRLPRAGKSDHEVFNELQTPFWKLMGQKPKPKDIAYEKYLKSKNMTYGDVVRERNRKASEPSAYEAFAKENKGHK